MRHEAILLKSILIKGNENFTIVKCNFFITCRNSPNYEEVRSGLPP